MKNKIAPKIIALLFLSLLLWSTSSFPLAMDQKLSVRVISFSNSKKTILVNRGLKDGLVVGDHAEFFITTVVVARGVVVKASPSRSIWSIYRLVNPQEIENDKVVNLKILIPVKLTEAPAKDLEEIKQRKKQLKQRLGNEIILKFNKGLNEATDTRDENNQGAAKSFDIGYEFHLMRAAEFLQKVTVDLYYSFGRNYYDAGLINVQAEEKSFLFGLNYYLYNNPSVLEDFMIYLGSSYRMGSALLGASTLSQKYLYSISSLPIIHTGIKYRFDLSESYYTFLKVGVAFMGVLSYEPTTVTKEEVVPSSVEGKIHSNQFKLALGISVMF